MIPYTSGRPLTSAVLRMVLRMVGSSLTGPASGTIGTMAPDEPLSAAVTTAE